MGLAGASRARGEHVVVTGGTGIGREVAEMSLERGDQVVILGRDAAKSAEFLAAAEAAAPADRSDFLAVDLGDLSENRRALEYLAQRHPAIDALLLCARHYRSTRTETADGLENTFALFYLSRFLFRRYLALAQLLRALACCDTRGLGVIDVSDVQPPVLS